MMKKSAGIVTSFCILLLVAMSSTLRAETVTANVLMTTDEEVGASAPLPAGARGTGFATFDITRDSTGKITAATVNFTVGINFPSGVTVTGLHIHSGARGVAGQIWANSGLGGSNSITFSSGQGRIELRALSVDLVQLQAMLNNPSQHYFNLHTTANASGAIRGQIVTLSETMGATVALTTAEEVGPSAPLPTNAFGSATATINPFRRPSDGAIIGGAINFVTSLNLPPNSVVTGFHIHEAAAGSNGAIVLDSSLSGSNSVSLPSGQGTLSFPIRLSTPAQIAALQRLMANPANFYFNVHTSANGSGVVRGQLRSLGAPPLIQQADTTFMTTGTTSAIMGMSVAWLNLGGSVLINGQQVMAYANLPSGDLTVIVPASMRQNPGTLWVQAQNFLGQRSMPYAVVVAPQNMVNSFPVTTVDSAKFGNLVSPESMASAFGTRLAMQTMGAPSIPLPYSLAGTRVYVNGLPAPLFYVSGAQVNYLIPWETFVGPGSVVVVSQDGTVSLGSLIMASTAPGVFTRLGNGSGAPNALSSPDGVTYTQVSNDDGTPRMINVGDYLVLFGGGWRYASTDMTVMIDNLAVPVGYRGPQGQFQGMDQINVQIPPALAGRGLVNLTVAVDGRPSNTVQINIR